MDEPAPREGRFRWGHAVIVRPWARRSRHEIVRFLQHKGTHHGHHDYLRPDWFAASADAAGHEASRPWGAHATLLHSPRAILRRVSGPPSRYGQRRRPPTFLTRSASPCRRSGNHQCRSISSALSLHHDAQAARGCAWPICHTERSAALITTYAGLVIRSWAFNMR